MSSSGLWQWGSWLCAGLVLVILALQYPLSTTFPMGGDAAQYVTTARLLLAIPQHPENLIHINHWYPLANILSLPYALLPISWPLRFTWWAVTGQIAVGLALGWFMYRLAGWGAGAASMAFWGLTPIVGTNHFTDGTIAQLWSYVFLYVCLERLHSGRPWWALLFLVLTFLTHPITGFALLFTLLLIIGPLWLARSQLSSPERRTTVIISAGVISLSVLGLITLWNRQNIFGFLQISGIDSSVPVEVWRSVLAPLIFLSPIGYIGLVQRWRDRHLTIFMLVSFSLVCLLLSSNNLLGISVWIGRLAPLFIILISMLAGVGWTALLRFALPAIWLRALITVLFFSVITLMVWQENKPVYAFNDSPSRYVHIHPDELAAVNWLAANTTEHSYVISSTINRHTEWIPALTSAHWQPAADIVDYTTQFLSQLPPQTDGVYVVFFLKRETVPTIPPNTPWQVETVFSNRNAVVWRVTPRASV